MRCQDCGAPCPASTITCPFCAYEVGLQRVSERQRLALQLLGPIWRLLALLFLILWMNREHLPYLGGSCCFGNIGG